MDFAEDDDDMEDFGADFSDDDDDEAGDSEEAGTSGEHPRHIRPEPPEHAVCDEIPTLPALLREGPRHSEEAGIFFEAASLVRFEICGLKRYRDVSQFEAGSSPSGRAGVPCGGSSPKLLTRIAFYSAPTQQSRGHNTAIRS